MVVTKTVKDLIKTAALDEFDSMTHIGFGTGISAPNENDTDLTTPIIRKAFDETAIRNDLAGTYEFSTLLGLTEGNGNDLAEIGLFDAASSGNMSLKDLLNNVVTKTTSVELSVGYRVKVNVN